MVGEPLVPFSPDEQPSLLEKQHCAADVLGFLTSGLPVFFAVQTRGHTCVLKGIEATQRTDPDIKNNQSKPERILLFPDLPGDNVFI